MFYKKQNVEYSIYEYGKLINNGIKIQLVCNEYIYRFVYRRYYKYFISRHFMSRHLRQYLDLENRFLELSIFRYPSHLLCLWTIS